MSLQTALIVDDSKLARITLQRLLEKRNFSVRMAESAVQALELLKQELPDIIFMDHLMPEIDGFEAMKQIKSNPVTRHIPVVMCTGKEGAENYDAEAKAIGAAATLSKPPELEQLNQVLTEAQTSVSDFINEPHAVSETANQSAGTVTDVDFDALEARVQAALQESLNSLREELNQELNALEHTATAQSSEVRSFIAQELETLNAVLLGEPQVRAIVQTELAQQLSQISFTSQTTQPEPLDVDAMRVELRDEVQGRLDAAIEQLQARIDSLQTAHNSLQNTLDAQAQQNVPPASRQDEEEAHHSIAALKTTIEHELSSHKLQVERTLSELDQRLAELAAERPQRVEAPQHAFATADTMEAVREALEDQISGLSQNLTFQIEQLQADRVQVTSQSQADDQSEWRQALESKLNSLQESLESETAALRAELAQAESPSESFLNDEVVVVRATDAVLASVEETIDALLAHKVEQIRNTLTLEIKAQARGASCADTAQATASVPVAEDVRRIAHEAVTEELDQASAHLVSRITEALRQQVEDTQQEILAKQDMFEQERGALRRQIRSLKNTLIMVSTGASLLAIIAIATTVLN